MKRRYIIGAIILCIGISLYLRIVLPYEQVFSSEWIKFTSIDAYWQMSEVDRIIPNFPFYFMQIFNIPFFIWLLSGIAWCIGFGSPSQHTIDTIAVYFPVILAALTIIPVYFIGKAMFGNMAGLVAAALIVVLPGEWLGRSLLGFTDHHVMEVLLSTTAIMFLVFALKTEGKSRLVYTLFTGLFLGLCLLTNRAVALFVGIIAIYLCAQIIINLFHHRKDIYPKLLLGAGAVAALVFYLSNPNISVRILDVVGALDKSGLQAMTTLELQPFISPSLAWATFGWVALIIPPAIAFLIYKAIKTGHSGTILLVIWSITTLALMIEYRRFAYYFAVNASLLTGWFIWYMWQRLKNYHNTLAVVAVVILVVIMIIPNTLNAVGLAKNPHYTPSDDWHRALEWVKENTDQDALITAWWDTGYWISYIGQRGPIADPSQRIPAITKVAKVLTADSIDAFEDVQYLILDEETLENKYWAVEIYSGYRSANPIVRRLWKGENVAGIIEVYKTQTVRVYEYDKE